MDLKSGRKLESKREHEFEVVEEGGNLIVTLSKPRFRAVYYKPTGRPQLVLRERTKTDDQEIIADAWKAANTKARQLGWIAARAGRVLRGSGVSPAELSG